MNTLPDGVLCCEETELIAFPFVVPYFALAGHSA